MAFKEFQRSRYQAIEGEHDHRGAAEIAFKLHEQKNREYT